MDEKRLEATPSRLGDKMAPWFNLPSVMDMSF